MGASEGASLGLSLGASEGASLGLSLGASLGLSLGASEGVSVGVFVGGLVHNIDLQAVPFHVQQVTLPQYVSSSISTSQLRQKLAKLSYPQA